MKSKGWNIGQGETLRRRRPRWAGGKALLDVGFNEPQEFIQIAEAAVKISAVSSSFASSIALRTSFATTA